MNVGEPSYWEVRYSQEIPKMMTFKLFDWYVSFGKVFSMVENVMDKTLSPKVLVIGVGRSNIIDTLYEKGYRDITAIDVSPTLIHAMQKKYEKYTGVEFVILDVREMSRFPDNTFSLVLDKGCIDALFCGTDFRDSILRALTGIFRTMQTNGTFISFSHAQPLARVPYFRFVPCALDVCPVVGGGESLFMYALSKSQNESLVDKKIVGCEATVPMRAANVVSASDQKTSKQTTTRKRGGGTGSVTVTSSVDKLAEMVAETAEVDG